MSPFPHSFASILRKVGKKSLSFFAHQTDLATPREDQIAKYRQLVQSIKERITEELSQLTHVPVYTDWKKNGLLHPSCWVVDLMLGEKNFLSGIQPFGLMMTEFVNGQAHCVAIFDPIQDEMISAALERGTFSENHRLKMHPSTNPTLALANSAYSAALLTQAGIAFRIYGSPEMEISWLCQGKAELCIYENYDIHPGCRLLIQEAQGSCFFARAQEGSRQLCAIGHKNSIQSLLKSPTLAKVFSGINWTAGKEYCL